MATYRLFPTNPTPSTVDGTFSGQITVGSRFRVAAVANATTVWFYKASTNTGTHIGAIWSQDPGLDTGTLLSSVTFTGETASGWQSMTLPSPVALTVGVNYVVGVYMPVGHFSRQTGAHGTAITNGILVAPVNVTSGFQYQPCYHIGTGLTYPDNLESTDNYGIDVTVADAATNYSLTLTATQAQALSLQSARTVRLTVSAVQPQALSLQSSRVARVTTSTTQPQVLALGRSSSLLRLISQSQSVALSGQPTRQISRTIVQAQPVSLSLTRGAARIFSVAQPQTLSLRRAVSLSRVVSQTEQVGLLGGTFRLLALVQATQVSLARRLSLGRTLAVTQAQLAAGFVSRGYRRIVAATQTTAVRISRFYRITVAMTGSHRLSVRASLARAQLGRVRAITQPQSVRLLRQVRLARGLSQPQSTSLSELPVKLQVLATVVARSLALGRAITLTRSLAQPQLAVLVRLVSLTRTLGVPTVLGRQQSISLTRALSQAQMVSVSSQNVTPRLFIILSTSVGQQLRLSSAGAGKSSKVFVVAVRDGNFVVGHRDAQFAVGRRGVRFTVEER